MFFLHQAVRMPSFLVSLTPIILQDKGKVKSQFKLAAATNAAALARRNKQQILFLVPRDSVRLKLPESDSRLDFSLKPGLRATMMIKLNLNTSAAAEED